MANAQATSAVLRRAISNRNRVDIRRPEFYITTYCFGIKARTFFASWSVLFDRFGKSGESRLSAAQKRRAPQPADHRASWRWTRRLGLLGGIFFLGKGLIWLAIAALAVDGCAR